MKITRIETIPISVPLRGEFAIRSGRGGAHTLSPFLLVKVHTDEGLTGLGEASCTPRWSGEDQITGAHLIHTYLEPLLVGQNPLEVESLTHKFKAWAYEGEWRIVWPGGARAYLAFNAAALVGVIFGCRTTDDAIRIVRAMLDDRTARGLPPVKPYRAERHGSQYALTIRRTN